MEPITIATSIMAILMPLVKKSAEAFAGEAGKAVHKKAKDLFATLKAKMSKDSTAKRMLERFEKKPDDYEQTVLDILEDKLSDDKKFASELSEILNGIKKSGPEVKVVIEMQKAEKLVAAKIREMSGGTVEVHVDVNRGKDITGVEIGKMG